MTHKTQELYWHAIQNLKIIAEGNGFKVSPTLIMCDFESALKGTCKKVFPEVKIAGCNFHFLKALYNKVKKLGLSNKNNKKKAKALISYLQIISHCPKEDQNGLFEEIKIFANRNDKFKSFLSYFKKNWLTNEFIDSLFDVMERQEDIKFIRTNNPCEVFHNFLGKLESN